MQQISAAERITFQGAASWRTALGGFGITTVLFIGLYWMTGLSLVETWARTGMFRYAFLIFPISAWLVWGKRKDLAVAHNPAICLWALIPLAAVAFGWFLGRITNVDLVQHVAFVATFPILVLLFFGTGVARALLFPLVYLLFAIPAGHSAVQPLQHVTAQISVHLLQWTGMPVLLYDNHYILTPSIPRPWEVAEACSGIRFFTACTAIGSLFAYLFFVSYWRRAAFIFASMIVPIIANGLRVYFTILIGETFGLKYAQGTDHMIFGWQFFGTVLFLLLLVGWFLREPPAEEAAPKPAESHPAAPGFKQVLMAGVAAAVVFAAAPAWAFISQPAISAAPPVRVTVNQIGGWTQQGDLNSIIWQPSFSGADAIVAGRYAGDDTVVSLYASKYVGAQVRGHDLLAYENVLFDSDRWHAGERRQRRIPLPDGSSQIVGEVVLQNAGRQRLMWYWYDVDGSQFTSPSRVRAWQAWEQLRGVALKSSVIAVSTPIEADQRASAEAALTDFVQAVAPQVERQLAAASRGSSS
ncbi:MAG TPA: exosortase A [Gammaproteobacteria bacterium]|nr:exosortase A [Gammaproteobacteria bacterium]